MSDERPSWDDYGIGIAHAAAERADCTRRKVGAALMASDHSIVGTGYNGAPPGRMLSCLAGDCPRGAASTEDVPGYDAPGVREGLTLASSYDIGPGSCIALHAEQNVLLRASWHQMQGATLYVTCEPCPGCQRLITGTPIDRVVWTPAATEREVMGLQPRFGHARVRRGRFELLDHGSR